MKKVLSTVAALGLVAGLASTAAAVEFKMSGKYLVEGAYLSDSRGAGIYPIEEAGEATPSDAYWLHTFEIMPTMKVNDKISMTSVIRLADDTFWGGQTGGDTEGLSGTNDVYVHQLYMDYASPIGKVRLGRTPAGTYGTNFQDANKRGDRIMWYPSFLEKPWSAILYIEKSVDQRSTSTTTTTAPAGGGAVTTTTTTNFATYQSDADSDKYVARLYYNTDTMDTGVHYHYARDMTTPATNVDSDVKHELTAYGKFKMDNFFLNAELTHTFGGREYDNVTPALADRDYDSWSGMAQVGGKFDALTPSLMYFYAQGQDRNADGNGNDIENALGTAGTGDQFEPLYILTGRHTGMLNNDIFNVSADVLEMRKSGVHAVVAAADYAVSNQLSLHGAIGWAQADEERYAGQDDEYGWEYNVGAAYKLLDNLTYEAHFGYLDTGDFFNYDSPTDITENVYLMTHSLTMTF